MDKAIIVATCNNNETGEYEVLYLNTISSVNFVKSIGSAKLFDNMIDAYNTVTWRFLAIAHWITENNHVTGIHIFKIDNEKRVIGRQKYI